MLTKTLQKIFFPFVGQMVIGHVKVPFSSAVWEVEMQKKSSKL
jgi:hypothetical protein